jgi:transcriptional regulator with XRE-family HTH domain
MEERGITQSDLARRLGVSRSCVHSWYWGVNEPGIDALRRIRRVFGCSMDELVGR